MTSSTSRSSASIWLWMFWALGTYLALELGLFVVVSLALHTTEEKLVGSYLAFAAPAVIFLPLVWWLRKWEERGVPPKRLALEWGLCGAIFFSGIAAALLYSGVELHLLNPRDVAGLAIIVLVGVFAASFSLYSTVLRRISAGANSQNHG